MPDFTKGLAVGTALGICLGILLSCLFLFPNLNRPNESIKLTETAVAQWKN